MTKSKIRIHILEMLAHSVVIHEGHVCGQLIPWRCLNTSRVQEERVLDTPCSQQEEYHYVCAFWRIAYGHFHNIMCIFNVNFLYLVIILFLDFLVLSGAIPKLDIKFF